MAKPTREDADVMLRLAEINALYHLNEAGGIIWSEDFPRDFNAFHEKYPRSTRESTLVNTLLGWFESVGTLVRNGLLSEDLAYDWLAIDASWERLKGIAEGQRKAAGSPALWENFEYIAKRQASWKPSRA